MIFNLVIAAIFVLLGILFLTGHGDVFLMLNNSITIDGTHKYDIEAVGKFLGKALLVLSIFFVVVAAAIKIDNTIIKYLGYGAAMVTILTTITHLNTSDEFLAKNKKKRKKR